MRKLIVLIASFSIVTNLSFSADKRIDTVKNKKETSALRSAMITMLVKDNIKEVIPVLCDIVTDEKEDLKLRISAAKGLGVLKDISSAEVLESVIEKDMVINDPSKIGLIGVNYDYVPDDYDLKLVALDSLFAIDEPKSISKLASNFTYFLDAKGEILTKFLSNLEKSKNKTNEEVIQNLSILIKHNEPKVRLKVIEFIESTNNQSLVVDLMPALEDKLSEVRIAAVKAIGKIGRSLAIPALIVFLEYEKSEDVRFVTSEVLESVKEGPFPKKEKYVEILSKIIESEKSVKVKEKLQKVLEKIKKIR